MNSATVFGRSRVELKSPAQLAHMREAGLVVAAALAACAQAVRPGLTTGEVDAIAAEVIGDAGATPSFLGYYGYPATVCVSVNDEVVHGIPGPRVLRDGDLVSIDCGAIVAGWHGDAAISVGVGELAPEVAALSATTAAALWAGIAASVAGATVGDVGAAIAARVHEADRGYGIVAGYTGHGIGSHMHMDPNVPNIGRPGRGLTLAPGMAIAIEPMVTLAGNRVRELDDGWTVVTKSGVTAAHWEHTVAVTPAGPWVLTAADGGGLLTGDPLA